MRLSRGVASGLLSVVFVLLVRTVIAAFLEEIVCIM
jgi:hypothetical protein